MILDELNMLNYIDWEHATTDEITIKCDGLKLKQDLYDKIKLTINDKTSSPIDISSCDHGFIRIYSHEVLSFEDRLQLAIETCNRVNSEFKSKLNL